MELELDTAAGKCFLFANSSESICAGRVRCIVSACTLLQPKRTPISAPKRSRGDGRNLRAQLFVQLLGRLPLRQRTKSPALRHWTTIPAPGPNRESGFDTLNIYRLRPGSSDTGRNYRRQTADRSGRSEGSCQLPEVTQLEDWEPPFFQSGHQLVLVSGVAPNVGSKLGPQARPGRPPSILHQCRQAVGCRWGFFFNLAVCGPVPD